MRPQNNLFAVLMQLDSATSCRECELLFPAGVRGIDREFRSRRSPGGAK